MYTQLNTLSLGTTYTRYAYGRHTNVRYVPRAHLHSVLCVGARVKCGRVRE